MRKRGFQKIKLNFAAVSLLVWAGSLIFFVPNFRYSPEDSSNYFRVRLNGEDVGAVGFVEDAEADLRRARRRIARTDDEMLFIDARLEVEGQNVFWGKTDWDSKIVNNMVQVLSRHEERTMERCYTVKMGEYTVNMKSREDIIELLTAVLEKYDSKREYIVDLVPDTSREISVLTPEVLSTSEQEEKLEKAGNALPIAGIEAELSDLFDAVTPEVGKDFEDYELGIQTINFDENIEIVEAYMPANRITALDDAIADVTGDVATSTTYEVKSGDTISGIASSHGLSVDQLLEINPSLDTENALILPGDTMTVTVASPKLSVDYTMQEYSEEQYTAETIYKDNDSWYTTKKATVQKAVPGTRRIIADVKYQNDTEISREIIKEETLREAVPEIIERGTKSPPTFIWPVTSGYVSSGFGRRNRPNARASSYHKGNDIAVRVGTSVHASQGGTVTQAGWLGNYGNVVFVDHANGYQTRYAHLSKVLVHVGQSVNQGDVIAKSGNTGNSTGPHLHFEMRVNGQPTDALKYTGPGQY